MSHTIQIIISLIKTTGVVLIKDMNVIGWTLEIYDDITQPAFRIAIGVFGVTVDGAIYKAVGVPNEMAQRWVLRSRPKSQR